MGRFTYLTRAVWLLSLISLFTDLASEMLYPVMPLYLQSIGFSMFFIDLLEGVAEAVAGLSKGYFSQWSDRLNRRVPFVQWGYGLSALSKPMLAVPAWVLLARRTVDRLGKGLRTGAGHLRRPRELGRVGQRGRGCAVATGRAGLDVRGRRCRGARCGDVLPPLRSQSLTCLSLMLRLQSERALCGAELVFRQKRPFPAGNWPFQLCN